MSILTVPKDAALAGVRVTFQAAFGNPASPTGLDLTNGLVLTAGY